MKPEWGLTDDEAHVIKKFSGKTSGWEAIEQDELLGSNSISYLAKRKVVADGENVNENEGFARWFD
jgi:hypothetical protein